jgi:hypothetical protein
MASLAATSALLFGSLFGAHSTSYSPCSSGTIMADGTHVRDWLRCLKSPPSRHTNHFDPTGARRFEALDNP